MSVLNYIFYALITIANWLGLYALGFTPLGFIIFLLITFLIFEDFRENAISTVPLSLFIGLMVAYSLIQNIGVTNILTSSGIVAVVLFSFYFVRRNGLGLGDVLFSIGASMIVMPEDLPFAFLLASLSGLAHRGVYLLLNKNEWGKEIKTPFTPFLSLGFSLVYGYKDAFWSLLLVF